MVTGRPFHDVEELDESGAASAGSWRARAAPRVFGDDHLAHGDDAVGSKNMCSVRTGRCPRRRISARCGVERVSALARTFMLAHRVGPFHQAAKSPDSAGSMVGTSPSITSPVPPSMVMTSPVADRAARRHQRCLRRSRPEVAGAGDAGLPMPRATTAAWLVMPPRVVRMPTGGMHAVDVLGLVSPGPGSRLALAARSSASSAVNTTAAEAAPGWRQAARHHLARFARDRGSGCSSWSSEAGSTRHRLLAVDQPLPAPSRRRSDAAAAVRLPLRVCSIQSLPLCTVNSMSCMSR